VHTAGKLVIMGVTALFSLVLSLSVAGAEGGAGLNDKSFQPQAAGWAGVYALRQIEPSLTGAGAKIALLCRSITYVDGEPQNDYRPAMGHNCFAGKKIKFHDQGNVPAGISPHSTAICSILLGEEANGFSPELGTISYQGVAPEAKLDVYEFWYFLGNNVFPALGPDADILAASIGSEQEDWWTRGIDAMAEHSGIVVVAGIGNGTSAHDPLLYPGAAANAVGVGVISSVNTADLATNLEHFALAYPEDSSFGPTAEGRCKPDIVAPGNCLAAVAVEANIYEPTGDWSSFSTPVVAGTVGLLLQKARQDPNLSGAVSRQGGNCVIKAILLNSATKLPFWHKGQLGKEDDHEAPLDYIQGAGMLDAVGAYNHLIAGRGKADSDGKLKATGWDNNVLHTRRNRENVYRITVADPGEKYITVTAVWNRHYKNEYPFDRELDKDSDLRIELRAVDPEKPESNYLLDYSDSSVDNVEHIYHRAEPECGEYIIVVSFSDTAFAATDKTQRYALAWNAAEAPAEDNIFLYDLNADGIVDKLDLLTVTVNWLTSITSPDSYFIGDINNNGIIDLHDLEILVNQKNRKADWFRQENINEEATRKYARNSLRITN